MTDQPGQEPEQRLSSPGGLTGAAGGRALRLLPTAHSFELTPERASRIVRASADARSVAFLAVLVGAFGCSTTYELGGLVGGAQPYDRRVEAQQVTNVERGYNVYQANCARCHGVDGEGGIGPVLNSQEKLFQHLNELPETS
jgi:cytochrome c553